MAHQLLYFIASQNVYAINLTLKLETDVYVAIMLCYMESDMVYFLSCNNVHNIVLLKSSKKC